jgi:HAD superfamily hydrolase (TIGR01509 family)
MNAVPPGVTTLVFDVDDTLVPTSAAWERALAATAAETAESLGTSADAVSAAYRDVSGDLWSRYDTALAPLVTVPAIREHVWARALAACGTVPAPGLARLAAASFGARQLAEIRPDPRLPALLARTRARYRVAACTNGEASLARDKLRRAGVLGFMETVTCGIDEHVRKPDPELFRRCCRALATSPDACAHIGDDWRNDILAASEGGLHPVWIHPGGQAPPPAIACFPDAASFLDALLAGVPGSPAPPAPASVP